VGSRDAGYPTSVIGPKGDSKMKTTMRKSAQNEMPQSGKNGDAAILVEGPIDATDCLRARSLFGQDGDFDEKLSGLGRYLREDVVAVLSAICDLISPSTKQAADAGQTEHDPLPANDGVGDTSDTDIVMALVKSGDLAAAGSFLRDFSSLISLLGSTLDPEGKTELRMILERRQRGKPVDAMAELLRRDDIRMRVKFALKDYGKREAAVTHVMSELGISRPTVFRALADG
jgi:hypothetical protein